MDGATEKKSPMQTQKHFVLVHGACHGAWSWFKVKQRLESAGYRVTALDLSASGTNLKPIQQVYTFHEYTEPLLELMESVPHGEKVILVGHSLGGLNLALAMDKFPDKIAVAVFLTAFCPDTVHRQSYVLDKYVSKASKEDWRDTQFLAYGTEEKAGTSMLFGPMFLALSLYQLSPLEDLELCKILMRAGSLFTEDLSRRPNFTNMGYGSVNQVYVVCTKDKAIPEEFQRWMIKNNGIEHVMEIKSADHMPMFSTTQELCRCLCEIATRYG